MIVDVFWVEVANRDNNGGDEIRRFRDDGRRHESGEPLARVRAKAFARTYAEEHKALTMVHWAEWEITRRGRETVGGLDNLASYDYRDGVGT